MKIQIPSHTKISLITRLRNFSNSSNNINNKYTLFTSNNDSLSNTLYYSENPILNTFNDTSKFSFYNFDKVYPPLYPINSIYQETLNNPINDLFYNKNSCILFFGPSFGGKSYLCRGSPILNENESGLLTRTVNDIFKKIGINNDFIVKISVYQVYLNKLYDLTAAINNEVFKVDDLIKKEIKNIKEFDSLLKEAINNRKNLSKNLNMNINDIKKKSHLIISLYIENKKDKKIIPFSQIDFLELVSSDFGLSDENEVNNNLKNEIYINTNYAFNAIADNIINLSKNISINQLNNNHILLTCLKNTLKSNSNIILFNCVIPWEFPLKHSYNSCKFINYIYNQIKGFSVINNNKISYSYLLDFNKINKNIEKNNYLNYNSNCNNNVNSERMNNYLNIDKTNNIIPEKEINRDNLNNKVEKYLLKLPNTNNKNKHSNSKKKINNNKNINNRIRLSFDIKHPPEKISKLNEINYALKELEKQNKKLNIISKEEKEIEDKINNNIEDNFIINSKNVIENKSDNINYAELKSNNIIMKEDIERLQLANKNLENYLSEERNRNMKIINQNGELENKIIQLEQILNDAKIKEEKNIVNEMNLEKMLNEKVKIDEKFKENLEEINKLKEEKDHYEVEYKILWKQFSELKGNYDNLLKELDDTKKKHDEQLIGVEEKVDNLLSEIDKLRSENNLLRKDNENHGSNLNEINNENAKLKEQLKEVKKENEIINMKYNELMKEYDKYNIEKMNKDTLKYKFEENKKIKNENKMKIVNELQSKIQNYRKQRLNQDINISD